MKKIDTFATYLIVIAFFFMPLSIGCLYKASYAEPAEKDIGSPKDHEGEIHEHSRVAEVTG